MLEIKDGKKILTTPISAEDLADIHIGDIVYLNGSMTTCRDVAHRRLVEGGRELPVDVRDAAIFHAGPIIRPLENDKFEMVSVGPTTSMRMEKFEKEFVEKTGVKVIIGKGGMGPNTEYACKNYKAIHCVLMTSKWETVKLAVCRLATFTMTILIAWMIFSHVKSVWIAYGVLLAIIVFIAEVFKWRATISVNG